MTWKKLLLIGDSHTEFGYSVNNQAGWVALLSSLLQRKCDVVNRGFSGYNSKNILTYLPEILAEFNKDSIEGVILFLGSNDSANGKIHIPLENYRENLQKIYTILVEMSKLNKEKIIVISPPRINDVKYNFEASNSENELNYYDENVKKYSQESIDFAVRNSLTYIDLYSLMLDYGNNYTDLLDDGLHLSKKGNLFLYEHLKPTLEKKFINDLEYKYPKWEDLSV